MTEKHKKHIKIGLIILAVAVVLTLGYIFFYPRLDMAKVKAHIAEISKNYSDPAATEKILLEGVKNIRWDFQLFREAKAYAKSVNQDVETVVVDASLKHAEQLGYL